MATKRFDASVMASAGIPSAAAAATASSTRAIPSTTEYSVCRRRWTKRGGGIPGDSQDELQFYLPRSPRSASSPRCHVAAKRVRLASRKLTARPGAPMNSLASTYVIVPIFLVAMLVLLTIGHRVGTHRIAEDTESVRM